MMPAYKSSQRGYGTLSPSIFGNAATDVFANLPVKIYQGRIYGYTGPLSSRFNKAKYLRKGGFI
jgi:hypothetical protein